MKHIITTLIYIAMLNGCVQQQTSQNLNQGTDKNSQNLQQQFDADKAICWSEIKNKYDCNPPNEGKSIIRGREDLYNIYMEAEKICAKDGGPQGALVSYLGKCLTQKNWANLWCCDKY